MGDKTKIEWASRTFNPWIGCSEVHVGCTNCYARTYGKRFGVVWGPNGTRRMTAASTWAKPLTWERKAAATGEPCRVFFSLGDPFEDFAGSIFDYHSNTIRWNKKRRSYDSLTLVGLRADFFRLIDATPHLTWILATKRPENVPAMWPDTRHTYTANDNRGQLRPNAWLLYSASDQKTFDAGKAATIKCHTLIPVIGLSLEPLIGPVDLGDYVPWDWVIVGGESGPRARPCNVDWIRSIVAQCRAAGVPCFVKQLGTRWSVENSCDLHYLAMKDPKGGDIEEFPQDLKIREFPEAQP